MKMQNVTLDQIVWNPWRDKTLYPISDDQISGLRQSIKDHGFFSSVKGRRRNGKVELGCGHARFEAAKRSRLDSMPIYIDDLDDDQMLRLMTDENALQSGANPGAVMNEVAAVTRRLMELLLAKSGTIVPNSLKQALGDNHAIGQARKRLETRLRNPDADIPIGHRSIRSYLGQGDPDKSHRHERSIREAMSALKQSGRYDDFVNDELRKHPQPVTDKPAKDTAVATTKQATPRRRMLDERCANVFPNDHQFHAFREAVTSRAAQQAIPVGEQYRLAKEIMEPSVKEGRSFQGATTKKQIGAPYIKARVQSTVQEALKKQREINKEEREAYLAEQSEARIEDELHSANASLRSLVSALARLMDLAEQFPAHPKLGGFSARLDTLVGAIQQFSKKLR